MAGRDLTGERKEYVLSLNHSAVQIAANAIRALQPGLPRLTFASLLVASRGRVAARHQDWHSDAPQSAGRTIALTYLTPVLAPHHGATEFFDGPVLGPAGRFVVYGAEESHRGLLNTSGPCDRVALGLVFSNEPPGSVKTIGTEGNIAVKAGPINGVITFTVFNGQNASSMTIGQSVNITVEITFNDVFLSKVVQTTAIDYEGNYSSPLSTNRFSDFDVSFTWPFEDGVTYDMTGRLKYNDNYIGVATTGMEVVAQGVLQSGGQSGLSLWVALSALVGLLVAFPGV